MRWGAACLCHSGRVRSTRAATSGTGSLVSPYSLWRWPQVIRLCNTCLHLPSLLTPLFKKLNSCIYLAWVHLCRMNVCRTTFGESVFSFYPVGLGNQVKELRPWDPSKDLRLLSHLVRRITWLLFDMRLFIHCHSHPPHFPLGVHADMIWEKSGDFDILGLVLHIFNHSTLEAEVGGLLWVLG